jgi:hypothetical protein
MFGIALLGGLNLLDPATELFDLALGSVELRQANAAELLAALPEDECFLKLDATGLELLHDPL